MSTSESPQIPPNRAATVTRITVEFFGIPRQRAGCASRVLSFNEPQVTISQAFVELCRQLPAFAAACLSPDGTQLADGYLLSINGYSFTNDPKAALRDGDSLLVFSADMGG